MPTLIAILILVEYLYSWFVLKSLDYSGQIFAELFNFFLFFQTENQIKAKDLSFVKSREQVKDVFRMFLPPKSEHVKKIIEKLYQLRSTLKASTFFAQHELVGTSLLIVYDEHKVGLWMIDFAKTVSLPDRIEIDHSSPWIKGNHEDGYLFGMENLIDIFEQIMGSHL